MTHHFSSVPMIGGSALLSQFDPPYKNSQPLRVVSITSPNERLPAKFARASYLSFEVELSLFELRNERVARYARVFFNTHVSTEAPMFRTFILPVILMGMVGGPLLYTHQQHRTQRGIDAGNPAYGNSASTANPWQSASYRNVGVSTGGIQTNSTSPLSQPFPQPNQYQRASYPAAGNYANQFTPTTSATASVTTTPLQTVASNGQPIYGSPVATSAANGQTAWAQPGMVPDFAKTETLVFAGDANGPDLNSAPMSFTPTIDLASLFRFDISESWVTQRWDRVSTSPADEGLHGLRVALVTGTNSWDLHGALTYYFDTTHRLQRITYRGWTGDANRLLQILQQQQQLKAQPTHWAGVYLSKRGGLLMKHPAVIDKSNAVQQLALILELNNPRGSSNLSNDFQSLLRAAVSPR